MDLMMGLLVWAQAQPGGTNASAPTPLALALRRWCAGLTLSSPQAAPGFHGLWALLAGLGILFIIALMAQGPLKALRQLLDVPGHIRLARAATRRVWWSSRTIAAAIAFTVISWTGAQTAVYSYDSGKADLLLLTKSRRLGELALEQGILAGLTPLRDVAGLGDNLPLLLVAAIVVFRALIDPQRSGGSGELSSRRGRPRPAGRPWSGSAPCTSFTAWSRGRPATWPCRWGAV